MIFYVDPLFVENWNEESVIAERLYLYKTTDNLPLADYFSDPTSSETDPTLNKILHGGKLEYKDNKPFRYKINITEHVSNLVNPREGAFEENIPLSLVVTSDVAFIRSRRAILKNKGDEIILPEGTIYNPLGTIISKMKPSRGFRRQKVDYRIKIVLNFRFK